MPSTKAPETARRMAAAARGLLSLLEPRQLEHILHPLSGDKERRHWNYAPMKRNGLPLLAMTPLQQQATNRLAASGLSYSGYVTAAIIMGLENVLDAAEKWGGGGLGVDTGSERWRDPQLYFVTIFGEPEDDTWGWRFEGHHVSIHYTIQGETVVAPNPTFLGANPAEAPFGGSGHLRPLADEEDLARELIGLLDEGQREEAVISTAAPPDIVQSNRSQVEEGALPFPTARLMGIPSDSTWIERGRVEKAGLGFKPEHEAAVRYSAKPSGLAASRLSSSQGELLEALVDLYIDRLPAELATGQREQLGRARLADMHFAWAGGLSKGEPHYYRLQAPRFLVEYDCTQNNANHIHAVWRDPEGDFGEDLLKRHYSEHH
ncbi:MAG: hypothetical protein CL897_04315 [Dehalococcoidia bacterium]|nr:hypothetical protein [Dehalococcoidia bacterium]HCV00779.1 hypothetical protein [Dehalococcoidia bacterium]